MQIIKTILGLDFYISELDQFLAELEKTYPKLSASQRAEKEKYARIYYLRDHAERKEVKKNMWEEF